MENEESLKRGLYVANIWMDHAPHMDPKRRDTILAGYKPEEYNARRYGYPERGSGRVFLKPIDDIICDWFKIPDEWDVAVGLDIGNSDQHATVAIFMARNPETGDHVVFDEYYCKGFEKTYVHARAILEKGYNPPIAFDYGGNRNHEDQTSTRDLYVNEGLDKIYNANKAVMPGLTKLNNLLSKGQMKVMGNCTNLIREYGFYYFDKGKPVKVNDDTIDAWRYVTFIFDDICMPKFQCRDDDDNFNDANDQYYYQNRNNNNDGY